jgi:hypothetical protein
MKKITLLLFSSKMVFEAFKVAAEKVIYGKI